MKCAHCEAKLGKGCRTLCRVCVTALPTWLVLALTRGAK